MRIADEIENSETSHQLHGCIHRRRVSFIPGGACKFLPGGGGGGARAPEPPVLYSYALLHLLNSANLSAARKS